MLERQFHQDRFDKQSQKYTERGLLKRVLDRNQKLSSVDFAHIEALRDNAEFEARHTAAFKEYLRQLHAVVENLKKKRDDPNGEGKNIRPLLLILSGGLEGPYGAGQAIALKEMGLGKTFNQVVGISTGAAIGGYFLSGNPEIAPSIYYEEMVKPEFFNPHRVNKMVDIDYTMQVLSTGPKALDTEAIIDNPTEFWVQAVNDKTGEAELINTKTAKQGVLQAMHASMALPFLYHEKVKVNDGEYVDGGLEPLPLEKVIAQFNPTDILILPNMSFLEADTFKLTTGERVLAKLLPLLPRKGIVALAEKVLQRKEEFHHSLDEMKKIVGVNIGMLWPPGGDLTMTGQDSDKMKAAALAAQKDAFEEFGEKREAKIY